MRENIEERFAGNCGKLKDWEGHWEQGAGSGEQEREYLGGS